MDERETDGRFSFDDLQIPMNSRHQFILFYSFDFFIFHLHSNSLDLDLDLDFEKRTCPNRFSSVFAWRWSSSMRWQKRNYRSESKRKWRIVNENLAMEIDFTCITPFVFVFTRRSRSSSICSSRERWNPTARNSIRAEIVVNHSSSTLDRVKWSKGFVHPSSLLDIEGRFFSLFGFQWDQGLLGWVTTRWSMRQRARRSRSRMCEGEQRKLVIPPHLGYGDRGAGKDIPGGATLDFEVELVKIERGDNDL